MFIIPIAIADIWEAGTTFTPKNSNVTYYFTEDVNCTSLDDTALNNTCLNITGGDFEGLYCEISSTSKTIMFGSPNITSVDIELIDLIGGNQRYNVSWISEDVDDDIMECFVHTQDGNKTISYDDINNECYGIINISQSSNNSFIPYVSDNTTTNYSGNYQGVEIAFNQYLADESKTNILSMQYYLKQYNLSNNLSQNYTNISWSLNSSDAIKIINLTSGVITQNSETNFSRDFVDEDALYTISGDTFVVNQGYSIYKELIYNNTLTERLPQILMTINLDEYYASPLAEKQDGILWPNVAHEFNGTHISFNMSYVNSSDHQYYRYSYEATLVTYRGELSADYELAGEYRRWTLDRIYYFNFLMTNKTVTTNIPDTQITEWTSRVNFTSTMTSNVTGTSYPHTTTANPSYAALSFSNANSSTEYDYTLIYQTIAPISGGGGGGGGGGSTSSSSDEINNETIEKIIEARLNPPGVIQFQYPGHVRVIPFLPTRQFYKEVVIRAVGGDVNNATIDFSSNMKPYFTGAICDMRTNTCHERISIEEDEEKYIFLLGNLSNPLFTQQIITDNQVDGYVQMLSGMRTASETYNLSMRKAKLFDTTQKISEDINIPHKYTYWITGALIFILLLAAIYAVLSSLRIM